LKIKEGTPFWVLFQQWLLARKFSECKANFWRVLKFAKMHDPPNFCDLRWRIWQVLSKFWRVWQG
jgi:hypothetical protein